MGIKKGSFDEINWLFQPFNMSCCVSCHPPERHTEQEERLAQRAVLVLCYCSVTSHVILVLLQTFFFFFLNGWGVTEWALLAIFFISETLPSFAQASGERLANHKGVSGAQMDETGGGLEGSPNSHSRPRDRKTWFVGPQQLKPGLLTKQTLLVLKPATNINRLNLEMALTGSLSSRLDSSPNCQRLCLIWTHVSNGWQSDPGQRSVASSHVLSTRSKSKADETATVWPQWLWWRFSTQNKRLKKKHTDAFRHRISW